MDYIQYYNLESYLFDTVQPRFAQKGQLSAADFFCIVIWKANRAKSKIAERLLQKYENHENLETAVQSLTSGLSQQPNAKDNIALFDGRLRVSLTDGISHSYYPLPE